MRFLLQATAAILSVFSHSSEAHSVKRNPLSYISRVDDPVLRTPSNRVHAHSSFELTFLLHDERDKVRIELEPNHDILSEFASITYLAPDGTLSKEEKIDRSKHRVFRGHTFVLHPDHSEWINSGWARITVNRDGPKPLFEGTFRVNGNHHHIQTATHYKQTRLEGDPEAFEADEEYMIVWRDSDITPDNYGLRQELKRDLDDTASTCSSDFLEFNNEDDHAVRRGLDVRALSSINAHGLFGRQIDGTTGGNGAGVNLATSIGSTNGCPTTRKVALVGIATDCTYTTELGGKSEASENIILLVNSASALYESTFNISLGIRNLTISEMECPGSPPAGSLWNQPCSPSVSITDRLNLFSQWRGQFADGNAYWTLLSTCNTEAAVGLAWLGQLCSDGTRGGENETVAGANVVVRTSTEWQVFAHESGHTFGAVHDCTQPTCADGSVSMQKCCPLSTSSCDAQGDFIMNPSTGDAITRFSPCSIGNICSAMQRNSVNSDCLTDNRGVVTITGSQCGNGIVEAGEDCDCGGEEGCGDNNCCDAKTCRYRQNARCDPSNEDCCNDQCQFASAGTVCRESGSSCDPQEACSGDNALCPADVKAPDGQSCGADGAGLTCASGQCTSRDLQCKTLVGTLTNDNNTYACDAQSCLLRCASDQLRSNACYDMQQYFLDGTPCNGRGHCSNGQCEGTNFFDSVGTAARDNLQIVIPVSAVVGGLVVIAIFSCCVSCFRRRRRKNRAATVAQPPSGWIGNNGGRGGVRPWRGGGGAPPTPPVPAPQAAARGSSRRLSRRPSQSTWQPNQQWANTTRVPTARYA